jgi:hypothetical protein
LWWRCDGNRDFFANDVPAAFADVKDAALLAKSHARAAGDEALG